MGARRGYIIWTKNKLKIKYKREKKNQCFLVMATVAPYFHIFLFAHNSSYYPLA